MALELGSLNNYGSMNILNVVALISELWCITTGAPDVPQWLHFLDRVKMTLNSLLHFLQAISAREELLGEGGGPLSRGRPRPSAIFKESRTKGGGRITGFHTRNTGDGTKERDQNVVEILMCWSAEEPARFLTLTARARDDLMHATVAFQVGQFQPYHCHTITMLR